MVIDNYVSLHVHSDYSRLDAISKIPDLAEKAQRLGMKSLALTDHGTISGWMKFYTECTKRDIKPIFGIEAYICDDAGLAGRTDKEIEELEIAKKNSLGPMFEMVDGQLGDDPNEMIEDLKKKKTSSRKSNHVILLAKNRAGYQNILKLSSLAYIDGYYYKPRIDLKLLEKHKEGLIVNSACLGGQIASQILKDDMPKAEEYLKEYKRIMGDDFYLELQLHPVEEQVKVNKALLELSEKYNVPTIISQDHHYTEAEDVFLHEVIIKLKNGQKDKLKKNGDLPSEIQVAKNAKSMGGRSAFVYKDLMAEKIDTEKSAGDSDGYFYNAREYYMKTFEELKTSWKKDHDYMTEKQFYDCIQNTHVISDKVESLSAHSTEVFLPKFDSGDKTEKELFKEIIVEGAKKRLEPKVKGKPELKKKYTARLKEEMDTIFDLGFEGYFLIVWDLIEWCRNNDIMVGPGRGSVGGSLVAYCVGITNVDPLEYDLLFGRFINKTRSSAKYKLEFDGYKLEKK